MAQKFLSIKNFEKYQKTKTKEGSRPWIKLWKSLLGDAEFMKLTPEYRFLYVGLILLADDCNNRIYADSTYLRQRLYMTHTEGIQGTYIGHTQLNLKPLYRAGFLNTSNLSRVLSEAETETEESRGECADAPRAKVVPLSRPSSFPDGFNFNERAEEMAKGRGLNVHQEFAAFRDHHVAKGSVFKDWDAAFRTWLRNAVKFAAKGGR
jgi:hypothetical protein